MIFGLWLYLNCRISAEVSILSPRVCECQVRLPRVVSVILKRFIYFLFSAFLINSSDRIIRVFDGQIILACKGQQNAEPEPIQKLQDLVNR